MGRRRAAVLAHVQGFSLGFLVGGLGQAAGAPAFLGVAAERVYELSQSGSQLCRSNGLLPKLLDLSLLALDPTLYRFCSKVTLIAGLINLLWKLKSSWTAATAAGSWASKSSDSFCPTAASHSASTIAGEPVSSASPSTSGA